MAHFALLWKARTIEKYRQNYENEKINSIFMSRSDMPDKTLFQRWRHYRHGMQKRLSRTFSKWYPEGSTVSNFFVSLRTDMKLPSILLRSLYGFVGGLFLTYLGFMFFVFQLSLSVMHATVLSSVMGVLLTLGLTFSNRTRCLILLLAPQLFSRVGRYTLTCYALVLILTGPATNTLRNSEVLSESMACSQERIKLSVRQINDSIKKPYNSIKGSLKITLRSMKVIVAKLKTALIRINRLILSIATVVQSGFEWLSYIAEVCNDALGIPHEKCVSIMKETPIKYTADYNLNRVQRKHVKKSSKDYIKDLLHAFGIKNVKRPLDKDGFDFGHYKKLRTFGGFVKSFDDIRERNVKRHFEDPQGNGSDSVLKEDKEQHEYLGSETPWFCNAVKLSNTVCDSLKSYEKFFTPADFAEETFLATIKKKLKTFVSRIRNLIHVKLDIQHTYSVIGNNSSTNQIASGVVTEIRNRADPILTWLSWSSCVTSLFLLLIIFRAKHYQRMFETRSRFDNRFITKEFRELDLKRLREGRETVLPLNTRERAKYVTTTSFRLVASEKLHLNRSVVFMTVTTFKLLIHIVADYSLYWVLTTIRYHGKLQSPLQPGIADTGASITGRGFVARLLQAFIDTMNAELLFPPPDKSCLPNPYPPDFKRYCQIGFLIFLLWFFALFEPYGLRMRHLIMGQYRPQRAKDRAVWLYNHILRTRASFMKFARRRLHREFKYSSHSKLTFHRWLQTHTPFPWVRSWLGVKCQDEARCLLCNVSEDKTDFNKDMIKCEVPNCPGNYCPSCFSDIGQLCTICLSPCDYGDFSDASLEIGSSDENDSDGDDNDHDGNSNRSHKRNSDNDFHFTGTRIDDEEPTCSRYSQRGQMCSILGNKEGGSETIPLLQHSIEDNNYYSKQNAISQSVNETIGVIKENVVNQTTFVVKENKQTHLLTEITLQKIKKREHKYENEILKDPVNIHTSKIISIVDILHYSLYEITSDPLSIIKSEYTTDMAKYLRKKKLIRRRKYLQNDSKHIMSFVNININDNTKKSADNVNKAKDFRKKIKKHAKNIKPSDLNKDTETNYYIEPQNKPATSKSKKRNAFNQKCHNVFFINWVNMKWKITPFKCIKKTQDASPIRDNECNRKKKRKKTINLTNTGSKGTKLVKKENFIGNSRLVAYLDERDWVNSYDSDKDVHTAEGGIVLKKNSDGSRLVNNILIPRLNLNSSSESIVEPQTHNIYGSTVSPEVFCTKTNLFSRGALGRILKLIVCSSCDVFKSSSNVPNTRGTFESLDTNASHKDDVHAKQYNTHSESASSHNKHVSIEERRYFQIKRSLSSSLNFVKHVYSSLTESKNEDNLIKIDNKTKYPIKVARTQIDTVKGAENGPEEISRYRSEKINNETDKSKKAHRAVVYLIEGEELIEEEIKKEDKEIQTMPYLNYIKTDDKQVTARPKTMSCGVQNVCRKKRTEDFAVQVTDRNKRKTSCQGCDAESMTCNHTCTCASQCHYNSKCVGTLFPERVVNDLKQKKQKEEKETYNSPDSSQTTLSYESDETRTDTTICSLVNVDCRNTTRTPRYEPQRRFRVKVVTKSNKSTLTDKSNRHDVSTGTHDWWSPIVERKILPVEKKVKQYEGQRQREKKTFKNRGVGERTAGEKMVTFKSKAQLIPSYYGFRDIMSPSRYLLESQKYYNELFYNIFTSPRICPVANFKKPHNQERERSQTNSFHKKRPGRKTKRLDEAYSPRRNVQTCMRISRISVTPRKNRRH